MKNSDLHVLYIITKLELGGAQKICLTLANAMGPSGIKSSLISGTDGILVPEAQKLTSIYLIDSFTREVGIRLILSEIKTFFSIIKIIKKLKKEHSNLIVHTHSTKAGLVGRWAAFFAGAKNRIHTIHGFGFNDFQSKFKYTVIFLAEYISSFITSHFICVSQKDRELGIKKFPKFARKSSIIRAAAEWDKFFTSAKALHSTDLTQKQDFIIGTISCFKPQKNLFDLLDAFKKMYFTLNVKLQQKVRLQIIGDGGQRNQIETWIQTNNLSNNIDLLGWQNDTEKFMRKWDVFALSSLWEGLPISVVEARLCKLPVVAYDVGGIFEVILNKQNGFLIPPRNIDLLTQKLKFLTENPNIAAEMGLFNDELDEFRDSVMVKQHVELYKRID